MKKFLILGGILFFFHSVWTQSAVELGGGYASTIREDYENDPFYRKVRDDNFIITAGYRYTHEFNEYLDLSIGASVLYYRTQYTTFSHLIYPDNFVSTTKRFTTHDYLSIMVPLLVHFSPGKFRFFAGPCLDYRIKVWHCSDPGECLQVRFSNSDYLKNGNNLYVQAGIGYQPFKHWEISALTTIGNKLGYATLNLHYYFNRLNERRDAAMKLEPALTE